MPTNELSKFLVEQKRQLRMSNEELAYAIGFGNHASISKAIAGGNLEPASLRMIADYFHLPQGQVFRMAGIINDPAPDNPQVERIMLKINEIENPEHYQLISNFVEMLLSQR